jgi:hypothetical protein
MKMSACELLILLVYDATVCTAELAGIVLETKAHYEQENSHFCRPNENCQFGHGDNISAITKAVLL